MGRGARDRERQRDVRRQREKVVQVLEESHVAMEDKAAGTAADTPEEGRSRRLPYTKTSRCIGAMSFEC